MSLNHNVILCSLFIFGVATVSYAKKTESYFQHQWCHIEGGQTEYTLPDRTRIDCLTESHAVEVDFAHKWAEAIGQSLHYSLMSGKRAGILLILRKPHDELLLKRIQSVIHHFNLPIDVFTLNTEDYPRPPQNSLN
jgi:hypothetical protein